MSLEYDNEYLRNELKRAYTAYASAHDSVSKMMQLERMMADIDRLIDESNAYRESHEYRFRSVLDRIAPDEEA